MVQRGHDRQKGRLEVSKFDDETDRESSFSQDEAWL